MAPGVTATHPIWSTDRQAWVSAANLYEGEHTKAIAGSSITESVTIRETVEPVFNLEVDGDHCYRVGQQGLLVHNSSATPCPLQRLSPGRREADASYGRPINDSEAAFRDYILDTNTNIHIFRAKSGGGLGDFLLVNLTNPNRVVAIGVELYNPNNETQVTFSNAGQVKPEQLALLCSRSADLGGDVVNQTGREIRGPLRFRGADGFSLMPRTIEMLNVIFAQLRQS